MPSRGLHHQLSGIVLGVGATLSCALAQAQLAPIDGAARRPGIAPVEATRAHPDVLGCVELVRDPQAAPAAGATALLWTGTCRDGLRDGAGLLKVFRAHELLVASSGRYQNGLRIGPWLWEFPDGRRLEARFAGDGNDPLERVFESAKGERSRQLWHNGSYVTDAGIAPPPELRPYVPAGAIDPGNTPGNTRGNTPRAGKSDAVAYAASHFRTANCAGKRRIDARSDFLATRRDVDLFVREGDATVRAEIDVELQGWSRAIQAGALRAAALTGAVGAKSGGITGSAGDDAGALRDRYDWVRCHQSSGLPFLARMQQSVRACERVSLIKLDTVRASGNPRLQAEFADCLHAEIHAPRWAR
jgi:hypothetical protein